MREKPISADQDESGEPGRQSPQKASGLRIVTAPPAADGGSPAPSVSGTADDLADDSSAQPTGQDPAADAGQEDGLSAKFQSQRDEARAQREEFRAQRDEARTQRNYWKERCMSAESKLSAGRESVLATDTQKILSETIPAIKKELAGLQKALKSSVPVAVTSKTPAAGAPAAFSHINYYKSELSRQDARPLIEMKKAQGKPLSVLEQESLLPRYVPVLAQAKDPPIPLDDGVAFLTVGNDRFLPGLEGLLLSFADVYPDASNDFYVFHDGSLSLFAQSRLREAYAHLVFVVPDMDWLDSVSSTSPNHKRIGKLGYMNLYAFTLGQYRRVVALDSDILIRGDISALWKEGDAIYACHDCGDREYVSYSGYTENFIVNSGVISLPARYLNETEFEEIKSIAMSASVAVNDLIDRFADQKVWNMYFAAKDVAILPINYNCNVKYVVKFLGGNTESVSIIHFAGPKPWNDSLYVHSELVSEVSSNSIVYPRLWTDTYRSLLFDKRLAAYRSYAESARSTPVRPTVELHGKKTCLFIGNGPSIQQTALELAEDVERFCFNWFILHPGFDDVRPEHLVLGSHMFFGGWNVQTPAFPAGYLERLHELKHRPVIWTSFYFKSLFDELGLSKEFEVNYMLFEKPFKRFIDSAGNSSLRHDGFLDDGRTGVLTLAVPIALRLGFERVVLVGCDSNYNRTDSGGNYFYDEALHTSQSTRKESLTSTWEAEGAGQFAYKVVSAGLQRQGVEFLDATIDGGLKHVRKVDFNEMFGGPRAPD